MRGIKNSTPGARLTNAGRKAARQRSVVQSMSVTAATQALPMYPRTPPRRIGFCVWRTPPPAPEPLSEPMQQTPAGYLRILGLGLVDLWLGADVFGAKRALPPDGTAPHGNNSAFQK